MTMAECPISPPMGWGLQKPPPGVLVDRTNPLADQLVAAWLFNEGAGRSVLDRSGYGHHASATGTVVWTSNAVGTGLQLSGSSGGYLTVLGDGYGSLFASQKNTMIARASFPSLSGDRIVFSYDYTSHTLPYYARHLRVSGSSVLYAWNDGSAWRSTTGGTLVANKPTFLVGVFESGRQETWINSKIVASLAYAYTVSFYHQPIWIGRANYSSNALVLHDLFFWNRALRAEEIVQFLASPYDMFGSGNIGTFDDDAMFRVNRRRRGSRGVLI